MKSQNQTAADLFRSIEADLCTAIKDSGRGFARITPEKGLVCPIDQGLTDEQCAKLSFAAALGRRSLTLLDDGFVDSKGPFAFTPKSIKTPFSSAHAVLMWDLGVNGFARKELLRFINSRSRAHVVLVYSVPQRLNKWLALAKKYAPAGTEITMLRTYRKFSIAWLVALLCDWARRKYREGLIGK